MMLAAGFSRDMIYRGSAANHNANNNNVSNLGRFLDTAIGFIANDEITWSALDVANLDRGMLYPEEVYLQDPNSASVSDSCDPDNGKDLDNDNAPVGGGSFGGNDQNGTGGAGGGYYMTTCDIWHYYDPWGNYSYSVKRNCRYFLSTLDAPSVGLMWRQVT